MHFEPFAFLYSNSDLSGQVASGSTDFGNLRVKYKITLFFYFTSHLPASFLLPSLFLHDPLSVCLIMPVVSIQLIKSTKQP